MGEQNGHVANPLLSASLRRSAATEAFTFIGFLVLTLIFTYPLITAPGRLLRCLNDPFLFTWTLNWVAENALRNPAALFDAPIFFPYGNTLAFSEPLLVPALLVAAPVRALGGNPVLAYNLTVILSQALCGWSACFVARRLTHNMPAAVVAGLAFAFCPFRTGYTNYLICHVTCAVPLALYCHIRFLETRRSRYVVATACWLWLQSVTIWYGGVPTVLLLAVATLAYGLLRPVPWQWRSVAMAALCAAVLALAVLPILLPYLQVRADMGAERVLDELGRFRADLLSYLDAGRDSRFYRLVDSGRYPGLFPGFVVLGFGVFALVGRQQRHGPAPGWFSRARRGVAIGLGTCAALLVVTGMLALCTPETEAGQMFRQCQGPLLLVMLALGTGRLMVTGVLIRRRHHRRTGLEADLVIFLALLLLVFLLVPLGPTVHLGGQPAGPGIYRFLYTVFPPLKSLRILIRLAYLPGLLGGLLAALGVARLAGIIPHRYRAALWCIPGILALEYLPKPLAYTERVEWDRPPAAYQWLAAQPGDFAIMEWPTRHEPIDSVYTLWNLYHGKRNVTGLSGFFPALPNALAKALQEPNARTIARLRTVQGLRYLLVHVPFLDESGRQLWERAAALPPEGLAFEHRTDDALVFRVVRFPETGNQWERFLATRDLKQRPVAGMTVRTTAPEGTEAVLDIDFNGVHLDRLAAPQSPTAIGMPLPRPYRMANVNHLSVRCSYTLPADLIASSTYRVGSTETQSPADILLRSAGQPYGNHASLRINAVEYAGDRRGYTLAAIDASSGRVLTVARFDPLRTRDESTRMVNWLYALRRGTIVAGVERDAGISALSGDARAALLTIGVTIAPTVAFRDSHTFVGVKGAPRNAAMQQSGPRAIELTLGSVRKPATVTISNFELSR